MNGMLPTHASHQLIYAEYQSYLHEIYDNENTIHFYEYGMYCLLQFLNQLDIYRLETITPDTVIRYLKQTKQIRQHGVLCGLRGIFRYLNKNDLTSAIAGVHAPRIKRVIPSLTDDENHRIEPSIKEGLVAYRDTAIPTRRLLNPTDRVIKELTFSTVTQVPLTRKAATKTTMK